MKCPFCDTDLTDIDALAARSDYEAEINRIAHQIKHDLGVDDLTACELAKRRIDHRRRLFRGNIEI